MLHSYFTTLGVFSLVLVLAGTTRSSVIPPKLKIAEATIASNGFHLAAQTYTEVTTSNGLVFKVYDAPAFTAPNITSKSSTLTKRDGNCEGASFQRNTHAGSPNRLDCHNLRAYYRSHGNSWTIGATIPGDWNRGVSHGTCIFGARTSNAFGSVIGNEDMGDLVRDTVTYHSVNGRCAAQGVMGCENAWHNELSRTEWAVWHS